MSSEVLDAQSMGIQAAVINLKELNDLYGYEIIFGSAEEVLSKEFFDFLKREDEFRMSACYIYCYR